MQDDAKRKRLVAAAAAYVAVHFRGRVLVDLKKDAVTLGARYGCGILQGDHQVSGILVRVRLGSAAAPEDFEDDPTWGCHK